MVSIIPQHNVMSVGAGLSSEDYLEQVRPHLVSNLVSNARYHSRSAASTATFHSAATACVLFTQRIAPFCSTAATCCT